jgi:hypothetical protein
VNSFLPFKVAEYRHKAVMHDQSCAECIRLWREYALATNADIKLNGQLKLAALRHDPGLSEQLAPASNAATHQRELLRQQIKEHETSHELIRSTPPG